jgi:alpha/beta superfamily hydrolase
MEIVDKHVSFPCETLTLEGVLSFPSDAPSSPGAVVCHPHPEYGGDMNNNVVWGIRNALVSEGFAVLRFNFRGVGASQGCHGQGRGEVEDVVSALSFLKSQPMVDGDCVYMAGYSFGAWVGLRAACSAENLRAVAGIAPPFGMLDFDFLENISSPILVVSGDQDDFCNLKALEDTFEKISSPKKKIIVRGTDHFYWGREDEVGKAVRAFFGSS